MQNNYSKDQAVQVLCFNSKTKENGWQNATVINTIPANDRHYRVEVKLHSGIELKDYDAAAPECVRPATNFHHQ